MAVERKLSVAYCVIALFVSVMLIQFRGARQSKAKVVELERKDLQWKLDRLENRLRIPSEALYYDSDAMKEISEIRKRYYEKHGTLAFLPYVNVAGKYNYPGGMSATSRYKESLQFPTDDRDPIYQGSFEKWWFTYIDKFIRGTLYEIRADEKLQAYFEAHPEEFDKRLKPWLVRVTTSYDDRASLAACQALLEWGDRSPEVLDALQRIIDLPKTYRIVDGERHYELHRHCQDAMALSHRYGLGLRRSEQSEIDTEN